MRDGGVDWDPGGPIVDVGWLTAHVNAPAVRVIDARPARDYTAGHLPGAVNVTTDSLRVPASDPESVARSVESMTAALTSAGARDGERLIFYDDFSGTSAARGVWMLDFLGISGGAMLDGGLAAWSAAGGVLSTEPSLPARGILTITPIGNVLAHPHELVAADRDCPAAGIIDTRGAVEFWGGTVPGSVHIDWVANVSPDGRFRPPNELRDLYDRLGFRASDDRPVVTFCGSGYRAAHTYVVLKALGFPDVRNYAPSWGEWSRLEGAPIERPDQR